MNKRGELSPVQQALLGVAISLAALGVALACGGGVQALPPLVVCQLDALRVLPTDPLMATAADAVDLITRLRGCQLWAPSDAGP